MYKLLRTKTTTLVGAELLAFFIALTAVSADAQVAGGDGVQPCVI
jgi:hypothetical protein